MKRRFRSKLRGWERGDSYIRLYPNPGFTLFGFHWCKAKGRGKH